MEGGGEEQKAEPKNTHKANKKQNRGLPGGLLVRGAASAGGPGFDPWCGRILYVGWGGNEISAPQLLSPCSRAHVLQLEKARMQQLRPSAAKMK